MVIHTMKNVDHVREQGMGVWHLSHNNKYVDEKIVCD